MTIPILADLSRYKVTIEAFLAWFPTKSVSQLDLPRMRNTTFSHSSADESFWSGISNTRAFGLPSDSEDGLAIGPQGTNGYFTLSLNEHLTFELEVRLKVGAAQASKLLVLEPDTITPFMVNVAAPADNDILKFTAATLHGVVTAGPRPLVRIGAEVRRPVASGRPLRP